MVAHQEDRTAVPVEIGQAVDDKAAVRPAIHVVAQEDELVVFPGTDDVQQRVQRPATAVDVADSNGSFGHGRA